MKKTENNILLIHPYSYPDDFTSGVSAGIAYLRGYLKYKGIDSSVINFNDILQSQNCEKLFLADLRKYFIENINKDFSFSKKEDLSFHNISNNILHYHPDKIWQTVDRLEKLLRSFFKIYISEFFNVEYLGFSFVAKGQLLFSLSLAKYVKDNFNEDIKIVFGGSFITTYYLEMMVLLKERSMIDYLIIGEGETPFYLLIKGGSELVDIPNLIYLEGDEYKYAKDLKHTEDITKLPPPIFELGDTPYIQATRKCYWGKCAFCIQDSNKFISCPTIRKPIDVYNDVKIIHQNLNDYKVVYNFTDNSLPISFLKSFSEIIIGEKFIPKNYRTYVRLEEQIDYNTLKLAKKAGFGNKSYSRLVFGVETQVERLLELLNRGINRKKIIEIIEMCAKLKININLHFTIGFPTQTKKELMQDLNFILLLISKHKNISIAIFPLMLFVNSDIYKNPQKFNIKVNHDEKKFFSIVVPFKQIDKHAISQEEAFLLYKNFYNKNLAIFKNHPFANPSPQYYRC